MRRMYSGVLMALMLCLPLALQAKVEHLLPRPQVVAETDGGAFALHRDVTISYHGGATQCALLEEFFTDHGCELVEGGAPVEVTLVESIAGAYDYELYGYDNEAYTLDITAKRIAITAVTNTGVIRAAQTLVQLAEGYDEGSEAIATMEVRDWPAFKLRGYMHDVGRSYIPVEELIKQVELLSRFKVNTFHWHLTENQAWRFEVKAYPALTSTASMTRHEGNYYTQDDCKALMAVARKHGVVVIPEIDMPGHSGAFERAMGFGMQTENGKKVLKAALDEVVEVFADAPYIHIGGDEVSTTAAYLNEMIAYVESKGKEAGIWNPINGIGQDQLNASLAQMWGTRGYVASGKANIDSRYNYTNHFDVFADLVGIYKSTIYYKEKGDATVAGTISACWNDRKVESVADIMAQNNVYANVIASAERAWIGGGERYIDNCTNGGTNGGGGVMLPNSGDEYEAFADWERRFLFHKAHSLKGEPIPYVKQTNVRWRITDAFPNGGDAAKVFPPEEVMDEAGIQPDSYAYNGNTYQTGMATGAGIYLSHTWGKSIINAYYNAPAYNQTAYAWTYVYSPEAQEVGAIIEFQNYSRSEQDPAPAAGKWDLYGSNIWLNGMPIAAPTYENTGVSISSKEVTLKNENFPARKPIAVQLKQGWNKVFLKLPYVNAGYRLDKWMFTFVLTDKEGTAAVDGLIYSPNQCMDEEAELTAAKISEVKLARAAYIKPLPGYWPESAAAALDAKIAEVEATFAEEATAEERAAQRTALDKALQAMIANCTAANMNQPVVSTDAETTYYRMYTPLRESRYPTAKGVGADIVGEQTPTDNAIWKFVKRADQTFDIVNAVDGSYISPASNYNTALKTAAESPSAGWTLAPADAAGYVIIKSGSVQFNQTNNSTLGYKVYNWGEGTNIDDTGCKYVFEEVEYTPDDVTDIFSEKFGDKPLRMRMYRDRSYTAGVGGTGSGAAGTTQVNDLTAISELWYVVGNADACKLYNKATGSDYALKVSGTADGSAATMAAAKSATTWKIIDKEGGYAIVPSNATGMSINAYGGKGGNLKLYNAADQGGWWIFDMVSENTLTLSVAIEGEAWEANPRVAEMNMTVNGVSSSTRISGSVDEQTYYLPAGATTFSLSSMTYRGYTFIGFEEGGRMEASFTDADLTDALNIKALYRANDWRTLYYTPDANGYPYRIPAIATAPNGHVFAISDNRPCGSDIGYGEVDIKCRISTDNGNSWGNEFFVANGKGGNTNAMTTGYGDAAIVADREQNRLLVMMVCGRTVCWNGRWDKSKIGDTDADAVNRVARVYATFNETTQEWKWTQPEEVTDHIYSLFLSGETPTVSSMFIGSGKICQSRVVKKGQYYRLYCSMWTRDQGNRVIYSDDFGGSWNVLGKVSDRPAPSGDEPKVEELPDGTVVLSSRKGAGRYFNLFTFADDTYTTGKWGTAVASNDVANGLAFGGNSTNGEILLVNVIRKSDGAKCDLMLQSVPTGNGRSDVAIFYKEMEYKADGTNKYTPTTFSQGWTKGIQPSDRGSAYSTMTMQKDGRVAFLYEEEPGGYCIVYAPLSIEDITHGAYTVDPEGNAVEHPFVDACPHHAPYIYDMMGRKLTGPAEKGIYIVGGKKTVIE